MASYKNDRCYFFFTLTVCTDCKFHSYLAVVIRCCEYMIIAYVKMCAHFVFAFAITEAQQF